MLHLRALIAIIFLLACRELIAQNVGLSFGNISGNSYRANITEQQRSSRQSMTLEYQGKRMGAFQYSAVFNNELVDYSDYMVTDAAGIESSLESKLGDQKTAEYFTEQSLEYSKYGHTATFSLFSSLDDGPFKRHGGKVKYVREFFRKTTLLGVEGTYFRQGQPENYFRDSLSYQWRRNSRWIDANSVKLFWQQVLSANSKVRLTALTGQREGERPRHWGGKLEYAQAFSDTLLGQVRLTHIAEDRSGQLMDNRGHFNLSGYELQLTYEPVFDFLVSISYGLTVEREYDYRDQNHYQMGIDSYGLGFSYLLSDTELTLLGSFSDSNTSADSLSLIGGVKWHL